MKKLFAGVLALLLLLSGVAALAAEEYGEPILFRGIEWGTSMEQLDEEGLLASQSPPVSTRDAHGLDWYLYRGEDTLDYSAYNLYARSIYVKDVGGNAITDNGNAHVYFVCVPDENGQLDISNHATLLLIGGEYVLEDYSDALFEIFVEKLSALYGDVDETFEVTADYGGDEVKATTNVWWGADGTRVALNIFEGRRIRIAYASGDYDAQLESATVGNLNGL